jgi:hypothetical protein
MRAAGPTGVVWGIAMGRVASRSPETEGPTGQALADPLARRTEGLTSCRYERVHKPSGSGPGRNWWASAMDAASAKLLATSDGSWASLPNVTASPPSSRHHWTMIACSGAPC